jgi:hypothetical protein
MQSLCLQGCSGKSCVPGGPPGKKFRRPASETGSFCRGNRGCKYNYLIIHTIFTMRKNVTFATFLPWEKGGDHPGMGARLRPGISLIPNRKYPGGTGLSPGQEQPGAAVPHFPQPRNSGRDRARGAPAEELFGAGAWEREGNYPLSARRREERGGVRGALDDVTVSMKSGTPSIGDHFFGWLI